jgi:hypothetical protein
MRNYLTSLSFRGAKATRNLQSVCLGKELQIPRVARDDKSIWVLDEVLGESRI